MGGAFKAPYFQYLLLPPPPPAPGWPLEVIVLGYRAGNLGVSGIRPAFSLSASCLLPVKAAWAPGSQLGPTALSFLSLPTSLYLHIQF